MSAPKREPTPQEEELKRAEESAELAAERERTRKPVGSSGPARAKPFVRREIWGLESKAQPFDAITLAYAEAVKQMQAKPITDPTSWAYQAAIHDTLSAPPPGADWKQCQHAGWFFLPWHRMYLYFFERIVRAVVLESGGPSDFALPYWNYNKPYPGNTIPQAFREPTLPDGTPNPLCLAAPQRSASYMAGGQFDPSVTSPAVALADTDFTSGGGTGNGFGGGKAGPAFQAGPTGDLELTPHNAMHSEIGGRAAQGRCQGSLMSYLECAALDPIFWLHHANIDRLWNVWIESGGGRADPPDPSWNNHQFSFYNEDGEEVAIAASGVLDTASQLDYVYDDAVLGAAKPLIRQPPSEQPRPTGPPELVAASETPAVLAGDPVSVALTVPGRTQTLLEPQPVPREVRVAVEDITAERNPGIVYGVYLDLPPDADVDERRDYHIGNLSLFGIEAMNDPDRRHDHPPGFRHVFNATGVVRRLVSEHSWDPTLVVVTMQPIDPLPPPGEEATWQRPVTEDQEIAAVEIGRIAVFVA